MYRYAAKRVTQALIVLFTTITISFVMYRLLPLGPVEIIRIRFIQQQTAAGQVATQSELERINALVESYTSVRPDQPMYIAYYDYMENIIIYQDFGRSLSKNEPVFQLLLDRLPWSLFLSIYGIALGWTVSLVLGALMAYKERTKFDTGLTVFTIINTSIPYYISAIAFVIIFGIHLQWLPTAGRFNPDTIPGFNYPYMAGVVAHSAMPIATTFLAGFGGGLAYRGNCIREMGKTYIRVGRLRGLSEGRLALRYIGRNSLLPIYTKIMISISTVFSSSIILEQIFNYRAMGLLTFRALQSRDYPVLMGALILFTAITVAGILVADLTYGIIDPRVEGGGERESF